MSTATLYHALGLQGHEIVHETSCAGEIILHIEPLIGHLKSDGRLERNHLKGRQGDRMNALLSGCGQNLRLMLNCVILPLFLFLLPVLTRQEGDNSSRERKPFACLGPLAA